MATTDSKAAVARTRSQTTLDAFFSRPIDLAASPLKQARRNVAARERPDPLPSSSADISAAADDDDPMHDHHPKRPSSPAKDAALLHERDHKRPRHGVFPPPKPSSLPPDPPSATTLPARAKSVPPLPLLDLNNVPPSPRRSPAKFRIASVPPEQPPSPPPKSPTFIFEPSTPNPHIPDTCMTPMSPLTPLPTNGDNTLDITLDAEATPVPKSPKPLLFTRPPPPPVVTAVAPHPKPPSSFIPRASGVKARMRPKGVPTAAAEHAAPAKKVRNPRDQDKKNNILGGLISSVKPTPSQAYKRAQSQPPTPSYLMPTTSSVARVSPAKPAPVHVVPRPAPRSRSMSRVPPAVPKLREISKHRQPPELSQPPVESAREERPMSRGPPAVPKLREPLNMSQDRGLEPPETFEDMPQVESTREERSMSREPPAVPKLRLEPPGSPAVPKLRDTSNHRQPSELSQPQVESAREDPSMSRGPPAVPKLRLEPPETSEGKETFEDMPQIESAREESLSPLTESPSEADAEERPQDLEALVEDDALPPDSGERTDDTEPDSAVSEPAPAPTPLPLNSSLSTLTEALERLNAPPPSRPQTSLGFHRAAPGASDGADLRASDTADTGGRGGRGGRGRGRGRGGKAGTLERPRPGTAMSTSSLPAATPASKGKAPDPTPKLRQTTLMLPPALPGSTRTTRLRAAALAAANAASSSSPGISALRTPAKEGGVLRQGPLTLGKPKSVGPPGSAAGPSGIASTSTSTSYTVPSRPGTLTKPVFGLGPLGGTSNSSSSTTTTTTVSRLTAMRGRWGGSRVTQRVSKVSSLPVVVGSPVKGGKAREAMDVDVGEEDRGDTQLVEEPEDEEMSTKDKIGEWLKNASKDVLRDLGHLSDEEEERGATSMDMSVDSTGTAPNGPSGAGPSNGTVVAEPGAEKAKEKEARRNASRRASMASHLLSQSLSALPSTVTPDKGKGRAVSNTYPTADASTPTAKDNDGGDAVDSESGEKPARPPAPRAHATRLATGALSTPPNAYKEPGARSSAGQEGSGKGKGKASAEESPARLAVLKNCRIFVDVRTDEGDDAGGLFVEMLEGLGAKIASKVGSRCTHVVFKNGLMSTLSRYKLLGDPKPHVVGIGWVVECAEQCKKVDEGLHRVNLDLVNVAGVNKRRKSYLPKHVSPVKMAWVASPTSSESSPAGVGTLLSMGVGVGGPPARSVGAAPGTAVGEDGDSSMQMGPPARTGEDDSLESLPPLERARRRKSMLPSR